MPYGKQVGASTRPAYLAVTGAKSGFVWKQGLNTFFGSVGVGAYFACWDAGGQQSNYSGAPVFSQGGIVLVPFHWERVLRAIDCICHPPVSSHLQEKVAA